MSTLSDDDRRALARAIERARGFAEEGARETLVQHTVGDAKPGAHLDEVGRRQRNKLRAHARQLGDQKRDDGTHTIERLVGECGYAHWHRMLFARFLAENSLLWHPGGFPVSLAELEDWAKEWGLRSHWEAAEQCAAQILPQIFGSNALVLSIPLSARSQKLLEETLESIPSTVFKARDALGWVYQFWQSAEKERINKSEVKIGADELPAVTQLFTEPYMVDFLLQNTLGAWWVGRHGGEDLPVEMPYLRCLNDGTPAAGTFEKWPETAKELTVLDPCCGSGHFLVAAFDLLVRFRMREEKLLPRVAAELVIRDNLHGLELDPRCTQIAAFALAFAAWTFPGVEQYFQLPELHVACVGFGIRAELSDWLALANGNTKFRMGMENLYAQFKHAPVLGSLIDPTAVKDPLLEASFDELRPLLDEALKGEKWSASDDASEMGTVAQGIAKSASILGGKYVLVCTNPPYLAAKKQTKEMLRYCKSYYEEGKQDLATSFIQRACSLTIAGGVVAVVVPQNWMFLGTFKSLRKVMLQQFRLRVAVNLGPAAFQVMNWWAIKTSLLVFSNEPSDSDTEFACIDFGEHRETSEKPHLLRSKPTRELRVVEQLNNPDSRIAMGGAISGELLSEYAIPGKGSTTGDSERFLRFFWEYGRRPETSVRWLDSPSGHVWSGRRLYLRVPVSDEALQSMLGARIHGQEVWNRPGVAVSKMSGMEAFLYDGEVFDDNIGVLSPIDKNHLPALLAFAGSPEYRTELRKIDQATKVTAGTLVKVPFDLAHWTTIAEEKYPHGLPPPHSFDPTQWLFKGDIPNSTRPLQVAVARLVGYRWPDQSADPALDELADNDGIVCLPAIRQEKPAVDRLLEMLVKAYGARWTTEMLPELLAREGAQGIALEQWLRDRFFDTHCAFFHYRPFVWQVWDGQKDGFSALLHYHRFTRAAMQTLIYTDLGDWIDRQDAGVKAGAAGAEVRLVAAKTLRTKLEAILEGEKPYDIFTRWKPLDAQPLGWEPDLDDGVRLNIRPFVEANILRTPAKNLKGIDWRKDRGKDPATAPSYKLFGRDRINDHHTTLAEKRAARTAKKDGAQ